MAGRLLLLYYIIPTKITTAQNEGSLTISRQNDIATKRYRDNVAISFCRDIVCLPNDFATNFMEYFLVEKEQF